MLPLLPLLFLAASGSWRQAGASAASFPQTARVEVCGGPASADAVESAVEGGIHEQLRGAAGATYTFEPPVCQPLPAGNRATYHVRVIATAPNKDEAIGDVAVRVVNSGDAMGREKLLWFCNKPENLRSEGPLFDGTLSPETPIRLLYHHQNRGTQPLFMRIELVNADSKPARVLIIPGDGRPNRDPVWSGIRAARSFLPALLSGSGEVIQIPPRSASPIAFRRLVMGDTASGLTSLKLAFGGAAAVEVRAEAIEPYDTPPAWTSAMLDPCPWHWVPSHPIFDRVAATYEITPLIYIDPFVTGDLKVSIGGVDAQAEFGVEGIPKQGGGRALNGNYGVLHSFSVTLANPTSKAGSVEFSLEATTNYTSGVFDVDGQVIWLRPLQQHESRKFLTVSVAAGQSRQLRLWTIPISGGYYPATIRLHPVAVASVANRSP